ncbi:MAG: transporter substrate-binding domain-containing protein [Burkholderiaceae bacterium]
MQQRLRRAFKAALMIVLLFTGGWILTTQPATAQTTPSSGAASSASPTKSLKIATREVPPFAFQDSSGKWRGIAIDMWEQIGRDLGVESVYESVSLQEMLDGIASGQFDAAVGALSVTNEREGKFDFSHPFFNTGLGIVVPLEAGGGSWLRTWKAMLSPAFLKAVAGLLALLTAVGALIWLAERRRNADQFPDDPARGIGAGLWWSSVTMTTVGYGDKSPETFTGRFIALIWMFVSVIIISTVTASLTTALTVDALSSSVQDESGLSRVRTGTVAGSTSAERLSIKGIGFQSFDDLSQAMQALNAGNLDAVVYDRPLLRYLVKTQFAGKLQVLKVTFEPQDYAIGLPSNSKLREGVNLGILKHARGTAWEALVTKYLGKE